MAKEYWTIKEVVEIFEIDESLLSDLEEEDIICPTCHESRPDKLFSAIDLEKLRLVKLLTEDMGVNLPGIDIILRMRHHMIEIRKQFDDILEDLAGELRQTLRNRPL
ncbi:chaperone modulator CbpM [Thermodesulfobacteriota bacterium]